MRDETGPDARRRDGRRDVGVAGHHERGAGRAVGELGSGDLACVERVHAERVRNPQAARGTGGDLGREVGEVAVQRRRSRAVEARGELARLLLSRARREAHHVGGQLRRRRVAQPRLTRLGGEDTGEHPGPPQGQQLVEGERLRQPRPSGDDDGHPGRRTGSARARDGLRGARHEAPPAVRGCPARSRRDGAPRRSRRRRGRSPAPRRPGPPARTASAPTRRTSMPGRTSSTTCGSATVTRAPPPASRRASRAPGDSRASEELRL